MELVSVVVDSLGGPILAPDQRFLLDASASEPGKEDRQSKTAPEEQPIFVTHTDRDQHACILRCTPSTLSLSYTPTPPRSFVVDYKSFVLVSTILRTFWISHLGYSRVGGFVPCLAWVREGIGTACRT
jgi:hypothetical protein